jgi:pimeloyl-ACP methyl ester carboxylesterase
MMTTVDGFPIQVSDTGPDKGSVVVLLGAAQRAPAAYDAVCDRLHTASLRTIVLGPEPRLTPKSVVGILDSLDINWGVLVGDRVGGELAWELAATRLDRFTGLVAIDRGHPRVADATGVIRRSRSTQPRWSARRLRRRWPGPASGSFTATTASWSCLPGATRTSRPPNWPPRSSCAPAPGDGKPSPWRRRAFVAGRARATDSRR